MAGEPGNFDPLGGLESLSSLEMDAATMHELFTTLMRAGFLERQALILVSLLIGDQDDGDDDGEVFFVQASPSLSVEEEVMDEDDDSGDEDDSDDEGVDED